MRKNNLYTNESFVFKDNELIRINIENFYLKNLKQDFVYICSIKKDKINMYLNDLKNYCSCIIIEFEYSLNVQYVTIKCNVTNFNKFNNVVGECNWAVNKETMKLDNATFGKLKNKIYNKLKKSNKYL